jgi:hypothetical protein
MNPTLPDEEWIKPIEAISWIAGRAGLTLEDHHAGRDQFLRKWRIRSTSLVHPLELILRIRAGEVKPLLWSWGDHEHELKVASEIEAERGLSPAVLLDQLKADLWTAWKADAGWNWAERQLLVASRDGRIAARGKPLPPGSRREDVPLADCAQPIPRTAFHEPAGFDLIDNCLTLRLDRNEDLANWRGPDWWDVRVLRSNVAFIFPPEKRRLERDVLSATSWTLLEALAWIITRDADTVRSAEADGAMMFNTVVVPDRRPMLEFVPGPGPSMQRINLEIVSRNLANRPCHEISVHAAGRRLKQLLALDHLPGHGRRNGRGDPERVPPQDWEFLEFADVRNHPCARPTSEGSGGTVWYDLRFPVGQVLSEFPDDLAAATRSRNMRWIAEPTARALYAERVSAFLRDRGRGPTEREDNDWRRAERVRRDLLRELRREAAGEAGAKGGRPAKTPTSKATPRED